MILTLRTGPCCLHARPGVALGADPPYTVRVREPHRRGPARPRGIVQEPQLATATGTRSRACSAPTSVSRSRLEMPGAFAGHYLDGRSAARRQASVRLAASGLEIELSDGPRLWWPFRDVRQTQGFYVGEQIRLERGAPFPEPLLVDDPGFLTALHATARASGVVFTTQDGDGHACSFTVGAALTSPRRSAPVLYMWGIPAAAGLLAARVPVSWEERLGTRGRTEISRRRRAAVPIPSARRLIGAIVKRLLEPAPRVPYTFRVIDPGRPDGERVRRAGRPGHSPSRSYRACADARGAGRRARSRDAARAQRHTTRLLLQHASTGLLIIAVSGTSPG